MLERDFAAKINWHFPKLAKWLYHHEQSQLVVFPADACWNRLIWKGIFNLYKLTLSFNFNQQESFTLFESMASLVYLAMIMQTRKNLLFWHSSFSKHTCQESMEELKHLPCSHLVTRIILARKYLLLAWSRRCSVG